MKPARNAVVLALLILLPAVPAMALITDRQQPLEVNADRTEGTLGDGRATLSGNVEITQGSLLIRADVARVEKAEGKVQRIELTGEPAKLEQEIEDQGRVTAEAQRIEYQVATGIVTLTGAADVVHPQYHISGESLQYDMNRQHFKGSGGAEDGRIRIRLDPEVLEGGLPPAEQDDREEDNTQATSDGAG
jgi:lipopolysaccharide export system protein LptA